ncbi:uncharacterized protein LOC122382288 isoform X4 [Amphibalanus amphitrite]|uniref:uncharacterized protein LOC122382288 isoform X4 n=1 Tax=Amphibalanus amphitrite TaxID=1232801 RepID=UPI001C924A46|nr:uncharacterized protein LOC122382288 isoform X4 [Amphibalanus amphitrite]
MTSNLHEVLIETQHTKKWTNATFEGTLPVLSSKDTPYDVLLNGVCGIVSEDSSDYLFSVGSFGTKIAEDVLDRYLQLQWDIAAEEDVSTSDMFFLLDSVRRSHRQHQDTKDDAAEPPDVGELPDPDQTAGEDGPAPSPSEDVSRAPSPASDVSGAEAGPVRRRLVLQSEEVLFLSHALGCVRVTTPSGAELAGERLYRHLAEECGDRHLAARYAAYLDLRGRGWVVRDGLQSGADFGELPSYLSSLRATNYGSMKLLSDYFHEPPSYECCTAVGRRSTTRRWWSPSRWCAPTRAGCGPSAACDRPTGCTRPGCAAPPSRLPRTCCWFVCCGRLT